jgi:hypothetical protein
MGRSATTREIAEMTDLEELDVENARLLLEPPLSLSSHDDEDVVQILDRLSSDDDLIYFSEDTRRELTACAIKRALSAVSGDDVELNQGMMCWIDYIKSPGSSPQRIRLVPGMRYMLYYLNRALSDLRKNEDLYCYLCSAGDAA